MKQLIGTAVIMTLATHPALAAECGPGQKRITDGEVSASQQAWGDGIVAIGKAKDPKAAASAHIDTLYAYGLGPVLFKPTKAAALQFRDTKEEALSYFVGGQVPEDGGFATTPFTKVRFENHATAMDCDSALAQGNYYFTTTAGDEVKVEYTFGYIRDQEGRLRINLHHSSVPYQSE